MLIKYYKSNEQYNINYSSRNRFLNIPVQPFFSEEQKSIKLGDGSSTQIKTSVNNICEYVTIDNTRWFVVSYVYLNGKQVVLNLQRDVIGEMGISNCYGKIERGYTETVLRKRKELQLNQILKERKQLIPNTDIYGNYKTSNHINEMWGILYLVKPSGKNLETGEDYPSQVNVNIPAFAPKYIDLPYIKDGSILTYGEQFDDIVAEFYIKINNESIYRIIISFTTIDGQRKNISYVQYVTNDSPVTLNVTLSKNGLSGTIIGNIAQSIARVVGDALLSSPSSEYGFTFPDEVTLDNAIASYNGSVVKDGDYFYSYSLKETKKTNYGQTSGASSVFINNYVINQISDKTIYEDINIIGVDVLDYNILTRRSSSYRRAYEYNAKQLTPQEAGSLVIDTDLQLVDEPYSILIFPLFDVEIKEVSTSKIYKIDKKRAFEIFNTVIEFLSGQNAYLVDAQIYPYCPELIAVATELQGYPFFQIMSTTFERFCEVQLLPSSDIKREYIQREYTIISPEQTGRFTFNFYDYVNTIQDNNGVNYAKMNITIKTALKPFSIISSAIILPEEGAIAGITYGSDLRGSQPSSNGFECSLSSKAFEEYKRSNSNYQAIFAKQREELKKQHEVELANDITGTVVNTLSATAMGAIAGASMADTGVFNSFGTKAAGAAIGGAAGGVVVGAAMTTQTVLNEKLRNYEEDLQKQMFDLNIGTIKNIPNSVNRISSFNEIMLRDFWYIIEIYECTEEEKIIVDNFIRQYGYAIGVFDYVINYYKQGWFLRSTLVKSNYPVNLHLIAKNELKGGVYIYE